MVDDRCYHTPKAPSLLKYVTFYDDTGNQIETFGASFPHNAAKGARRCENGLPFKNPAFADAAREGGIRQLQADRQSERYHRDATAYQ